MLNKFADHQCLKGTELLSCFEKSPLQFVDVGARGGVHDHVEPFARYTSVLAFEPDREECDRLLSLDSVVKPWAQFSLLPMALSSEVAEKDLYLLSASTNHSLLPPNDHITRRYAMPKWQLVGRESLQTTTLDRVVQGGALPFDFYPEFIKLDTQGSEYDILQGARVALSSSVVAVVTEVSFAELYKGQKRFSEVELLLREFGFTFYGFDTMFTRSQKKLDKVEHVTRERALYTDAIFFKDPLESDQIAGAFSERNAMALFISACLLGYYDFAIELAEATWTVRVGSAERLAVENFIKAQSKLESMNAVRSVEQLHQTVRDDPARANLAVGRFVDERRQHCDYHDVFNTLATPTPKE